MHEAIFFAVAGNAKLEIGIGQLGCAAGCATMKRLFVAARLDFETFSPNRDFFAMPQSMNEVGTKKDKVIA